jgi:hypothetical protein
MKKPSSAIRGLYAAHKLMRPSMDENVMIINQQFIKRQKKLQKLKK